MSPGKELVTMIEQRAGSGGGTEALRLSCGPVELTALLTESDRLGCSLERIEFRTNLAQPLDSDALWQLADRIAKRIQYLLESLEPIELDRPQQVALIRSRPPAEEDQAKLYYEATLDSSGQLVLRRWRRTATEREPERMVLTFQTLRKLADDVVELLTAAARPAENNEKQD